MRVTVQLAALAAFLALSLAPAFADCSNCGSGVSQNSGGGKTYSSGTNNGR